MFLLVQSLHSDSDRCVKTLYLKRISTETAFFYSFSVQAQLLLWNVLPKCFWNSKFVLTLGQCAEIVLKRANLCNHVYVKCTINKEALGKSHAPNKWFLATEASTHTEEFRWHLRKQTQNTVRCLICHHSSQFFLAKSSQIHILVSISQDVLFEDDEGLLSKHWW